jgi:hypothetical protein
VIWQRCQKEAFTWVMFVTSCVQYHHKKMFECQFFEIDRENLTRTDVVLMVFSRGARSGQIGGRVAAKFAPQEITNDGCCWSNTSSAGSVKWCCLTWSFIVSRATLTYQLQWIKIAHNKSRLCQHLSNCTYHYQSYLNNPIFFSNYIHRKRLFSALLVL